MDVRYSFVIKSVRHDNIFYTFKSHSDIEETLRPIYDIIKEGIKHEGEALVKISDAIGTYIDNHIDFFEKTDCIHPSTVYTYVLDCLTGRLYTYKMLANDSSVYDLEHWYSKILMVTRLT